jgi:hypothetical protein
MGMRLACNVAHVKEITVKKKSKAIPVTGRGGP